MNYYTETIPVTIAEKLKEKGMPMKIWNGVSQEIPFLSVMEDSSYDWLDKELRNVVSKIERRYTVPDYAEVFDWLMEKGWLISVSREYDFPSEQVTERFEWEIEIVGCFSIQPMFGFGWCDTWHEAANSAIEKALTLI